jgi:hypothetical protein
VRASGTTPDWLASRYGKTIRHPALLDCHAWQGAEAGRQPVDVAFADDAQRRARMRRRDQPPRVAQDVEPLVGADTAEEEDVRGLGHPRRAGRSRWCKDTERKPDHRQARTARQQGGGNRIAERDRGARGGEFATHAPFPEGIGISRMRGAVMHHRDIGDAGPRQGGRDERGPEMRHRGNDGIDLLLMRECDEAAGEAPDAQEAGGETGQVHVGVHLLPGDGQGTEGFDEIALAGHGQGDAARMAGQRAGQAEREMGPAAAPPPIPEEDARRPQLQYPRRRT